jgi:hypothetical protein
MLTTQDTLIVLLALRDLLMEFPPTTEAAAVSARQQARMVLRKYEDLLNDAAYDLDS